MAGIRELGVTLSDRHSVDKLKQLQMWFFNKKKDIDYDNLVSILERGDEADIQKLLWQPKQGEVKYLPVVATMLQITNSLFLILPGTVSIYRILP